MPVTGIPRSEDAKIAAVRTLEHLRYTYHGGEQWKPPLGSKLQHQRVDAMAVMKHVDLCAEAESVGLKLFANREGFILRDARTFAEYHAAARLQEIETAIATRKMNLGRVV